MFSCSRPGDLHRARSLREEQGSSHDPCSSRRDHLVVKLLSLSRQPRRDATQRRTDAEEHCRRRRCRVLAETKLDCRWTDTRKRKPRWTALQTVGRSQPRQTAEGTSRRDLREIPRSNELIVVDEPGPHQPYFCPQTRTLPQLLGRTDCLSSVVPAPATSSGSRWRQE